MKLIFVALAVCIAGAANALTTVTFDGNVINYTPSGAFVAESQGFLYDGSFAYLSGQHLALHDDTGITTSTIRAQNGTSFTPISIDLLGFSKIYKTGSGPITDSSWYTAGIAPPLTINLQGLIGSQVVATQSVSTSNRIPLNWGTTSFGAAFAGIDGLVLSLQFPTGAIKSDGLPGIIGSNQIWCDEWCGEYWADNLVLSQVASVPLPASGFLLLGAMLGMLGLRRIKAP